MDLTSTHPDTWHQVEQLRRRLAQTADACHSAETALRRALDAHNPAGGHRDDAGNLTDGPDDADLYDLVDTLVIPRISLAYRDALAAAGEVTMPADYGTPA